MSTPRVSVLMVIYNGAAYLGQAIESVLAQTMTDLELVLVDDGSTDLTAEITAHYAKRDERVAVYRQENQGIGGAMNQALRLARAPYVAILDSDDTMAPARLSIQADYLDQHPDIAAVGSQWFTMNPQGITNGVDRHPTDPDSLSTLMFAYFAMHHPTIIARKEVMLTCGGYAHTANHSCGDYAVFINLLLAGHRMTNLPYLLTRWRLNPDSVTHSKGRAQTENCITIRANAFARLDSLDSQRATQVALDLVRTFPDGSWFDEKVSRLIPNPLPSPALLRWREIVAGGDIPELEASCVDWLHDELNHAERLADLLRQEDLPWLGQLVLGKTGHGTMSADFPAHSGTATPATLRLTLLIPTQADDQNLLTRIRSGLETLPEHAEMIVFSTGDTAVNIPATLLHPKLRILATTDRIATAWRLAFSEARGQFIACMAMGHQHHPEFLAQSLTVLQSSTNRSLVYAPSDVYYPDALDYNGNATKDPGPEPRWTRQTLLGRDRGNLSCMVFRRELIGTLPMAIEETGAMTSWAIARCLLSTTEPHVLPLHNIEFAPTVALTNNIMNVLIRRLLTGYLDTGLGCVPAPPSWPQLAPAQGLERLRQLDARLLKNTLCIHPGNVSMITEFTVLYAHLPAFHPVFNHLLAHHPAAVLDTLRQRGSLTVAFYTVWRLLLRGYGKARTILRGVR